MLEEVIRDHRRHLTSTVDAKRTSNTDRDAFVAALQAACTSHTRIADFKSVATVRSQLRAEFIHLHYAREGEDFFPSKMILILSPDTSSLTAATNALYLAQLATTARDQRLLRNAALSYRGACQLLQRDLSKPKACYDDHVFGTIHVLSLCEAFKGISINDADRGQHTKGMDMLFQARGPKSLRDVYMMIQLQQHHHRVLLEGLLSRKQTVTGKSSWLDVDKNCHLRLTSLTSLALRVPGALEAASRLLTQGSQASLDEIMDMLASLKSLESRLQYWMATWYTQIEDSPYWKIHSTALPWLPKISAFTSSLQFPTPLVAKAHVLYWMPLLALREVVKEVAELHPFPILAATAKMQSERLHDDISECADNLCMTAMYLTNPASGFDGCMEATGPLLLASRWFHTSNDQAKLGWCDRMLGHIEDQGIRIPRMVHVARIVNG